MIFEFLPFLAASTFFVNTGMVWLAKLVIQRLSGQSQAREGHSEGQWDYPVAQGGCLRLQEAVQRLLLATKKSKGANLGSKGHTQRSQGSTK